MSFLQKLKLDKSLLLAFVSLGAVVILLKIFSPGDSLPSSEESKNEAVDIDTMIPAGHLLIPLELVNAQSLSSLSGAFSLVDLYAVNESGKKSVKLASTVKLVQAPLNPEQFAVLVREEDSSRIMSHSGPFFAALKNPQEPVAKKNMKKPSPPLIIHYGE